MRFVSVIGHPFAHQLTNINDGCRLRDVYIYAWPPNGNPWIPAGPGQNFWLFKLFKNKRSWNNGRCLTNRSPPLAASNTNSNLATVAFLYIHILSNQWRCIHQIVMKILFSKNTFPQETLQNWSKPATNACKTTKTGGRDMGMCFLSTFPSQKFQGDMCRWYELYLHFLLGFFFEDGLFSAGTWFLKRAGTSSNLWLDSLLLHATPAKHGPPWMWVSMLDMPSYHEIACQSWLLEQNLYRFWTLQYTLDVHSIYI